MNNMILDMWIDLMRIEKKNKQYMRITHDMCCLHDDEWKWCFRKNDIYSLGLGLCRIYKSKLKLTEEMRFALKDWMDWLVENYPEAKDGIAMCATGNIEKWGNDGWLFSIDMIDDVEKKLNEFIWGGD